MPNVRIRANVLGETACHEINTTPEEAERLRELDGKSLSMDSGEDFHTLGWLMGLLDSGVPANGGHHIHEVYLTLHL